MPFSLESGGVETFAGSELAWWRSIHLTNAWRVALGLHERREVRTKHSPVFTTSTGNALSAQFSGSARVVSRLGPLDYYH